MANFALKVEEIINEVNKMHLVTLQHAAEISPLVLNRSIGPDVDLVDYGENDLSTDRLLGGKDYKNEINRRKTPPKEQSAHTKSLNNEKFHREPSSLQNLDFQTVNSSILLKEAEEQRKRSIRQQIIDLQEKHITLMHATLKPIEEKSREERRKWLEKKRRSDSKILQQAEEQTAHELKEHERQLENLRLQAQKQLQIISFQGISQYQSKFRSKYETIVHLLMSIDKQALMSCAEYNKKLKELIQMFEQLIGKIKAGECGPTELKTAENLCKTLEDLEINIVEACSQERIKIEEKKREQQKKEEELAKKEQAQQAEQMVEAQQKKQEQQLAQITNESPKEQNVPSKSQVVQSSTETPNSATTTDSGGMSFSQFVSSERLEFYTKINSFYQEKVERVKVLQSDETMKKYRFDCQKNINIPVNAISAVSQQHIQDKYEKLYTFVTTQPTLGRDYCILLMAKKFVGQGETTISSNPQAAFPVASVIVSLWKNVPEFGQLFLAYVFKECPFLVPYFMPQKKGQTIEEYSKVLGYRMTDGQIEQQDMYLKRQTGVARLYAAVMITNGRQQDGPTHPYGVEHAWRWLTNFIALDPLPDICATLIMEILQIVGSDLWTTYGRQFVKLLVFIQHQYFPKLSAVDEGGPKARLELLLSKFIREGQIQKPQGILPQGFCFQINNIVQNFHGISQLLPGLYLCGASVITPQILTQLGINFIINATSELPDTPLPTASKILYLRVNVLDSIHTDLSKNFDEVTEMIEEICRNGGKCLIHCVAGVSRSATLCLAYLIKYGKMNLKDAFLHVKSTRPIIRPNLAFFQQLRTYEQRILGMQTVKMIFMECLQKEIPDVYEPEYRAMEIFYQKQRTAFKNRQIDKSIT